MRVLLDDEPITPEPVTVADAIEAARARAEHDDRLIIEVEADGGPIADELLNEPPSDDAGISELRLVSTDRVKFIRVTIGDAVEAVDHAVERQAVAAELIESGDVASANQPLSEALTTWQALHDVVDQAARLMGVDPGAIEVEPSEGSSGATTGSACIANLLGALEEIKRSVTERDTAGLADTLREDMDSVARDWRSLLDALSARAGV